MLYIGTSGYDYLDWKGVFYPENIKKPDFLSYYATQFNSLELNGTYYKMPSVAQMQNMVKRAEGKLKFSVKAYNGLTHSPSYNCPSSLITEFKKALDPLKADNSLLCILLQFPQSFHYEYDQRYYLDMLLEEFSDIPVVLEMRNEKWQTDKVYNSLRQRRVSWCITDNPALKNLPKLDFVKTGDIAYIRFHGRNTKNWYTGDNVSRYDYDYTDTELQTFVEPVKTLLQQTKTVQLFFNNHAKSHATVNAKKIEILLK